METKLGWRSVPVVTKMGLKSDHKKLQICNLKKFGNFLEFFINVLLISMENFISRVIFVSSATLPFKRIRAKPEIFAVHSCDLVTLFSRKKMRNTSKY